MFYTINSSTLLVPKEVFILTIIWVITNSVHCLELSTTNWIMNFFWMILFKVSFLYPTIQQGQPVCSFQSDRPECFNPCLSNPCHNSGTCESVPGYSNYSCICPPGCGGDQCQHMKNVCTLPQENNGCESRGVMYYFDMFTQRCEINYSGELRSTCRVKYRYCMGTILSWFITFIRHRLATVAASS